MSKVYITDYIKDPYIEKEILGSNLSTSSNKDIEVLLVWHERIDSDYIDQFPNLKAVVRYGVGYDVIDLRVLREKKIVFCNTPDYGTDEVSDTAVGMILNVTRGISRYDVNCRNYENNLWQENTIIPLKRSSQMTVGVVGAGRIGGSILRKLKAIGFKILFFDPYKERGYEKMLDSGRVESLDELLSVSDIVSINTPLTKETKGMVDINFINKMKDGAIFVNTARGEIVDNLDDFIQPLKTGKIFGLAFDVLPHEPPNDCNLINEWRERKDWIDGKLIINPHVSYYSKNAYKEMREKAAKNAKRILDGKKPFNIITG
jgi:lactate dehydrogenase-like 2-hydroxyacid dehydrogenase